jgi:MoaA/NifB/PqqE/SkfB family radical SAM enzyme
MLRFPWAVQVEYNGMGVSVHDRAPRFKIIYLELTNACNFTCDYCPIDQQTRKKVMIPTDLAARIINEIADNRLTCFLTFHIMGEPYLHKDLVPLTQLAESRGIRVRLLTNGSLLESKINLDLFATGLSRLEVGFRTPNEHAFDLRLRSHNTDLENYIGRIKGVIEDKLRSGASTELCLKFFLPSFAAGLHLSETYDHLTNGDDNLRVIREIRGHIFQAASRFQLPVDEWKDKPLRILDGEYPVFPGINVGFSRIQDFWMREQRGANDGHPALVGGCSAAFKDDFGILASGEVTTCCVDYDGRNVVGDLRKNSLTEVLESVEARRMRRSFDWFRPPTKFCRECLGGPTLGYSLLKQATSIAVDIRDRINSRKNYHGLRMRLDGSMSRHHSADPGGDLVQISPPNGAGH